MYRKILPHYVPRRFYTDNVIVNKQYNMRAIRQTTHKLLNGTQTNDKYYIGLVHTYPAWVDILNMFRSKKNFTDVVKRNLYSAQNPYGHTLVEFFKNNSDTDTVMNVGTIGMDRRNFINFIPSEQYYFNNKQENSSAFRGNHQSGMLERSFISIIIDVNKDEWLEIQKYYEDLRQRSLEKKDIEFRLMTHLITNKLRYFMHSITERGNCTYWTSKGFEKIGMLDTHSNFPMVCFYKLLLNIYLKRGKYFSVNDRNYCIVFYKGLYHSFYPKGSYIYPLYWLKYSYSKVWHVQNAANIKVKLIEKEKNKYDVTVIQMHSEKPKEYLINMVEYLKNIFK
jgi:hypothetical protein